MVPILSFCDIKRFLIETTGIIFIFYIILILNFPYLHTTSCCVHIPKCLCAVCVSHVCVIVTQT